MSTLLEIVRNVIVIVMVASFLEILLPDGKIKPFVRFAIGLFVIVAVLNPTLSLLFASKNLSVQMWDYKIDAAGTEQMVHKGMQLNQEITEKNVQLVKSKLQGQIEAVVMLVPGVKDVEAEVEVEKEGLITGVNLVVTTEPQPVAESSLPLPLEASTILLEPDTRALEKKINGVLSNFYGLEGVDISIEFKGG
ncbi:MAG: stage III sporulation protein AF [Syntrophomonadaceae bacterium]|nr:stage III sporulation protein AF [Syntrophomonadaceae bacterium]